MDMGLEPFNVASALNLVLAQRLLRRICPNCKVQYTPTDLELDAAKVKPTTTLRDLRFTAETIDERQGDARRRKRCRCSQKCTLDTTVAELPFFKGRGCDAVRRQRHEGPPGRVRGHADVAEPAKAASCRTSAPPRFEMRPSRRGC